VALGRFRQSRGEPTKSKRFDGDTFDGEGEALRQSFPVTDEGDDRMRELMAKLDQILARPDAPKRTD
jgi:hypothetical protein